jgi:hypothetical protein
VLIDSSQKKWIYATLGIAVAAAGVYVWVWSRSPDLLTGGSPIGLWYGTIGSLLMIYAGLLSALRKVPTWTWLGPRKVWLRGHVWLGLLSVLFILFHSGFRLGGVLEKTLWVLLGLITLSGIFGLLMQQFLPRMLTSRVPCEAPAEQIPHLCRRMREEADDLVDGAAKPGAETGSSASHELTRFYDEIVRPFLGERYLPSSPLASPFQANAVFEKVRAMPGMKGLDAQVKELEGFCTERRFLGEQQRLHHWLHGWLFLHVPMSAALLVLGLAHAILSLYF